MESAVLSPAPGQTVVAVEEGHRHGGHGGGFRSALNHAETRIEAMLGRIETRADVERSELRTTQREILCSTAVAAKDAAVGFKDNLVTAYQVEGRAAVAAEKHAGDAFVQAEKLAAAAELSRQTCCCELKELIRSDGEKTRDLINGIELQNQRDRAAKAEAAYMALFTSKVPPVTPTP